MKDNTANLPPLRFPEFKGDREWCVSTLETIFDIKNGYTPSKMNPEFWADGTIPWFRMEDIRKNGNRLYDSIQHVTPVAVKKSGLFPADSIILSTTATIGEHALIKVPSLANQQLTYLSVREEFADKIDMEYFNYYMCVIDEWCKRNTKSGGLLSVNMAGLRRLNVYYPANLDEQRKIADCFFSIDNELGSLYKKNQALKEHKKSLLQRIFPEKGKTRPEFRFPEFKHDGEWIEAKISHVFDNITRGAVLPVSRTSELPDDVNKYPVYSSQTTKNGLMGYYREALFEDAITWTTDGANAGTVNMRTGKFYCTNVCGVLISNKGYANRCMAEIIGMQTRKHVMYVGNPKLMNNVMGKIEICYPPSLAEQKKISECLDSLEKILAEIDNKILKLEQHKIGLRQKLFISVDKI